jgi:hypothetical protein
MQRATGLRKKMKRRLPSFPRIAEAAFLRIAAPMSLPPASRHRPRFTAPIRVVRSPACTFNTSPFLLPAMWVNCSWCSRHEAGLLRLPKLAALAGGSRPTRLSHLSRPSPTARIEPQRPFASVDNDGRSCPFCDIRADGFGQLSRVVNRPSGAIGRRHKVGNWIVCSPTIMRRCRKNRR